MPACPGPSGKHREPHGRPFRPSGLVFEEYGSAGPGGRAGQPVIIRHFRDSLQAIGFRQPGYAVPSIAGPSVQSTIGLWPVKTAIWQCQPGEPASGHPRRSVREGFSLPRPRRRPSDEVMNGHPEKGACLGPWADARTGAVVWRCASGSWLLSQSARIVRPRRKSGQRGTNYGVRRPIRLNRGVRLGTIAA